MTQGHKQKVPYIEKVHDKIADEISAKGHSMTLIAILSKMGLKRLDDLSTNIK